ncbi:MAG: hypothetical protein IPK87_11175 [Planctomycetes bacterium]|nr:hypothetical protein [Planctomycetota bacterium]
MHRKWLIFAGLAVIASVAALLLTLLTPPPQATGQPEMTLRRPSLPAPMVLPKPGPPTPARVELPAPAPAFENSDPPVESGRSLRGAVYDCSGSPVAGVLICAIWFRVDEFGFEDRVWGSELQLLYAAMLNGASHPNRELVHMRTARTRHDGTYEIDGLPAALHTVWSISKMHELRDANDDDYRTAKTLNWSAEPLHQLTVQCEFPDGSTYSDTQVASTSTDNRWCPWPVRGTTAQLQLVTGRYTISANNDSFGYVAAPVQCDVDGEPQTVRLIMERLPRLEIAVVFEGASLHSGYRAILQSTKGTKQQDVDYHPLAGVWAASDLEHGAYDALVTCNGDTLCSVPVHYNGGVQRIELRVPEPRPADCCILRTNASRPLPKQQLRVYRHGADMVIWLREEGEWLLQPGKSEEPQQGKPPGLFIWHEGWGQLTVAASGDPGSTTYAEFQRPARLKVPFRDLPNRRASFTLQVRREDGYIQRLDWIGEGGVALQPGVWTLEPLGGGDFAHLLPVTLNLKPGELRTHVISFSDLCGVCIVRPEPSEITSVCFSGPYALMVSLQGIYVSIRVVRYLQRGLWNIEYVTRYRLRQKFEIDLQTPYRLDLPD